MAEQPTTETLAYRELANRLGISVKAAKARAKRHEDAGRWFRFQGNDGRVRVRVPVQDLESAQHAQPDEAAPVGDHGAGHAQPPADEGWTAYKAATDAVIEDLRGRLDAAERARGEALAEARQARQEAEAARVEAAELRGELAAERRRFGAVLREAVARFVGRVR